MSKCPICDERVKPRAENAAFPFCSPRCKTIDLGKWLNEEYRVPAGDTDMDEDGGVSGEGGSPPGGDMRH
jgi:endogenous inhibitor of DNA gyrase (YacG/DUF329 family)